MGMTQQSGSSINDLSRVRELTQPTGTPLIQIPVLEATRAKIAVNTRLPQSFRPPTDTTKPT